MVTFYFVVKHAQNNYELFCTVWSCCCKNKMDVDGFRGISKSFFILYTSRECILASTICFNFELSLFLPMACIQLRNVDENVTNVFAFSACVRGHLLFWFFQWMYAWALFWFFQCTCARALTFLIVLFFFKNYTCSFSIVY